MTLNRQTFKKTALILALFGMIPFCTSAQESEENKHSVSVNLGHVQVLKGVKNNNKTWIALPNWAVDYNFKITPKWAIGLHNDIVLSDFEVESNTEEGLVLERSHPLATMISVGYFPLERFMVYVCGGAEFSKEDNFGLIRLGIEPSIEINEQFELVFGAIYDFKINAYDSFGFSIGVAFGF